MLYTLQKNIGCFNHRVVTLVADKLMKLVLVYSLNHTADNLQDICDEALQRTTLQNMMLLLKLVTLSQMFSGYCNFKIIVVISGPLLNKGVTPSHLFSS